MWHSDCGYDRNLEEHMLYPSKIIDILPLDVSPIILSWRARFLFLFFNEQLPALVNDHHSTHLLHPHNSYAKPKMKGTDENFST